MGNRVRIGVIGAGWWACENHIPILKDHPLVELVGVCTVGKEQLATVQDAFSFPFATEDYRVLLGEIELDGVVVSSPHPFHYDQAKAALEGGCHVLVEKPFTTDAEDARALVRIAEEKGLTITIPFGWNFKAMTAEAVAFVRSGVIGDVRHVVLQMASPTADLFAGQGLAGTESSLLQPNASTWSDPEKAGGYGWGQLAHALGLMFLLVDDDPLEVFAMTGQSPTGVDYYDAAALRFRNGATGSVSGAGTMPVQARYQVDLRIFGTKGHLCIDVERERVVVETLDGQSLGADVMPGDGDYECLEPLHYFVDACRGEAGENPASGVTGRRTIEFLDAMYRSAKSGALEKV